MSYTTKYIALLEQTVEDNKERITVLQNELAMWMQLGVFEEVAFNYFFAGQLVNRLAENSNFLEVMTEVLEEVLTAKRSGQDQTMDADKEDWFKKVLGELDIDENSMPEGDNDSGGQ